MLCVSFDRSHQFGVVFAIDLIKGIMHCLMSFTLGWVEKNCNTFFDPKLTRFPFFPDPLSSSSSSSSKEEPALAHSANIAQITGAFYLEMYLFSPLQIDSRNQFCFNFHFHKSLITTAGINMKIGYLPYARECWENHKKKKKKFTVQQIPSQLEFSKKKKRKKIFFPLSLSLSLTFSFSFSLTLSFSFRSSLV